MEIMKYKGYGFPYNPKNLVIKYSKTYVKYPLINQYTMICENNSSQTIVNGKGSFFGENAFLHFKQLENIYNQDGYGQLILPGGEIFDAYFGSLNQICNASADVVDYEFGFICIDKRQSNMVKK